jgi:hypothetical protein
MPFGFGLLAVFFVLLAMFFHEPWVMGPWPPNADWGWKWVIRPGFVFSAMILTNLAILSAMKH